MTIYTLAQFDELYAKVTEGVVEMLQQHEEHGEQSIQLQQLIPIVVLAMQHAKQIKQLPGVEKKRLVLDVIQHLVLKSEVFTDDQRDVIREHLIPSIESTVDFLVAVGQGKYQFPDKIRNGMKRCWARCTGKQSKRQRRRARAVNLDGLVDALYNEIRQSVSEKNFTVGNAVAIVLVLMQAADRLGQGVSGAEKKQAVIRVVERLIAEIDLNETDKQALLVIVRTTLSPTIDWIVEAAKGFLSFAREKCQGCCGK